MPTIHPIFPQVSSLQHLSGTESPTMVLRVSVKPWDRSPHTMQRAPVKSWLNLLLAIMMVFGPWPVLSGTAAEDGCCTMAMETLVDGHHGGCDNDHSNGSSCADHGCPGAHCSVTAFLPTHIDIALSRCEASAPSPSDCQQPEGASAPPTPPPIYSLSA